MRDDPLTDWGIVGGTKTDMVVWANADVFLQIWIGVDAYGANGVFDKVVPTP